MPRIWPTIAALLLLGAAGTAPADEPGPLAPPDEKLDYLLSTWRGKSLEDLRRVWGKEAEIRPRGNNAVHLFERRIKVRASILGSVSIYNGPGIQCIALFEVNGDNEIVRVTRRGGGRDCWNAFRRNEPR